MAAPVAALTLTAKVRINGASAEATLTLPEPDAGRSAGGGVLRWRLEGGEGGGRIIDLEADVLGLEAAGSAFTVRAFSAADGNGGGPRFCVAPGEERRVRRDYVVELTSKDDAGEWIGRIRASMDLLDRPKRLFVLVNPFGGKKCARKVYETEVSPLLEAAGIKITMQETEYQLHAREIVSSLNLAEYDGIVCVSGDGILVEVVNGLLLSEEWKKAIKIPIGVIPAGTGNGMAKSLLHSAGEEFSVENATFAIIRGHKRHLDVATVTQGDKRFFSVLLLTWGLVADIDIESEKYRWMGSARLDFYSLLRITTLRKYHGSVQFVPAPGYEGYGEPLHSDAPEHDFPLEEARGHEKALGYHGPSVKFGRSEWRNIDGPFISVWINNVPWVAEHTMAAPQAKFADGYLDAIVVRECPKLALLNLLLKLGDGTYVKSPYVTYLKVKAARLSPGHRVDKPNKGGIIDCDGEVIARADCTNNSNGVQPPMAYGPLHIAVDQGLATLFGPR